MADAIPSMQQVRAKQIEQYLVGIGAKIHEAVSTNKTTVSWPLPFDPYSSLSEDLVSTLQKKGYRHVNVRNVCRGYCEYGCDCVNPHLYIDLA